MKLVNVLEAQVRESDSSLFEVRDQMERNLRYYSLERIGNEQKGRSHYISPDVHDYVESKKGILSRTFLSNREVVKFQSGGSTPYQEAVAKTSYVNKSLDAAGKEELFHDLWHDALTSKKGTLLVEWMDDTEVETITLDQPLPREAILAQVGQDPSIIDIDDSQAAITPMGNTILLSGQVSLVRQAGYFEYTVCAPERVYRDPESSSKKDCMWWTYEADVPRGTLISEGYNREQVLGLAPENKWRTDDVDFSRSSHDSSYVATHKSNRDDYQETVPIYKTFTWLNLAEYADELDIEVADEMRLYKICWSNDEVLTYEDGSMAVEEVEEYPFFEWSELRISHAANGMCGADVLAHTQKANTNLKRQILDNANIRNNTRFEAVHDNILNPRDLIDNTIGGVVFTEAIGSIQPLAAPELSPITFQTLQMMKEDAEARSGLNSLTKGLNGDVLANQNASDMVDRLTNAAGARPAADARSFAQTFLAPLFRYIVKIASIKDFSVDQTEARGEMIPINPQSWQGTDEELEISLALTPEEADKQSQKLMVMYQTLAADPVASELFTLTERHAMLDEIFDGLGVADTQRFMKRPDDPDIENQNAQMQEMSQMIQMLQAQVQELSQGVVREQLDQQWAQINNSMMDKMEDNARADRELMTETRQGDEKLEIDRIKAVK